MSKEKFVLRAFKLPPDLDCRFERWWKRKGYQTRSDAYREAVERLMDGKQREE